MLSDKAVQKRKNHLGEEQAYQFFFGQHDELPFQPAARNLFTKQWKAYTNSHADTTMQQAIPLLIGALIDPVKLGKQLQILVCSILPQGVARVFC